MASRSRFVAHDSWMVNVSRFIQINGQISRLPRSTALRAKGCASLEMTTKWIPAHKPPILPSLTTIYNLFMQNEANFQKSQVNVSIFSQMAYEEKSDWTPGENEPNSKPNKANRRPLAGNPKHEILNPK